MLKYAKPYIFPIQKVIHIPRVSIILGLIPNKFLSPITYTWKKMQSTIKDKIINIFNSIFNFYSSPIITETSLIFPISTRGLHCAYLWLSVFLKSFLITFAIGIALLYIFPSPDV